MTELKATPGPCHWNGNEIVRDDEPDKGIAGLAPGTPDEWGPFFAAAPELYEALNEAKRTIRAQYDIAMINAPEKVRRNTWDIYNLTSPEMKKINAALSKARGETE